MCYGCCYLCDYIYDLYTFIRFKEGTSIDNTSSFSYSIIDRLLDYSISILWNSIHDKLYNLSSTNNNVEYNIVLCYLCNICISSTLDGIYRNRYYLFRSTFTDF